MSGLPRTLCPFRAHVGCGTGESRGSDGRADDWVWPADNTGLEYYDLSIPWGHGVANWPYFEDVKIERVHYHAEVTGADAAHHDGDALDHPRRRAGPRHRGHAVPGRDPAPLLLRHRRRRLDPEGEVGGGHARTTSRRRDPKIQPGDIVIVNTGWHHHYGDNSDYYAYSPGFYKEAGEWFVERGVKAVGTDTQALDHPLATAIAPHGPGWPHGLLPWACQEYKEATGHDVLEDFPLWEPCHRALLSHGIVGFENVGGDIDAVTGKRVTFAAFPWRWMKGDGCIIRLVAMLDPTGKFRIAKGSAAG